MVSAVRDLEIAQLRRKVKEPKFTRFQSEIIIIVFMMSAMTPCWLNLWYPVKSSTFYQTNPIWSLILFLLSLFIVLASSIYFCWKKSLRREERCIGMRKFAVAAGIEYVDSPLNIDGFDIIAGSVIAHGDGVNGYENLWSGSREGYSFRVIDYTYSIVAKTVNSQTIICIKLDRRYLKSFSIITKSLKLEAHQANKIISPELTKLVPKGFAVAIDASDKDAIVIPSGFLSTFRTDPLVSVEYLGDRLLVYCFRSKLTQKDLLAGVDFAVRLAKKLELWVVCKWRSKTEPLSALLM